MLHPRTAAVVCLLLACTCIQNAHAVRSGLPKLPLRPHTASSRKLLNPTSAGYLPLDENKDSSMFYLYFEADTPAPDVATAPIVLWLQGGPGCSSMFGAVYLNGPYYVQPDMSLVPNPGRWNRHYGTLYVDQPLGVGFSTTDEKHIPRDELTAARDLYAALQSFYAAHPAFKQRPLYITGESYAGKYVPSITHYIIQAKAAAEGWEAKLRKRRALPADTPPPVFVLGGAAIGNGFTDAAEQTLVQGQVAWNMGLIDTRQLRQAEELQTRIVEHVRSRQWRKARALSDQLLAFIANASDSKTLEDVRRDEAYDAPDLTTTFFNLPHIQANIAAHPNTTYISCSPAVDAAFGGDVMKSTANLVPDMLEFSHLLLYQGQWDAECGVASNEAWISKLQWTGHSAFNTAPRNLWKDPTPESPHGDITLGYWKYYHHLTHMIIRNAGHMVPHDRPEVSQLMLESWVESTRRGKGAFDPAASQGLPLVRQPAAAAAAAAAAATRPSMAVQQHR